MVETKEQQECQYCHDPYKPVSEYQNGTCSINSVDKTLDFEESWDYYNDELSDYIDKSKINYCPMCGRKLVGNHE